jgi:cyclopropane fatty-acyl-phospholipid synthase-like methyltransferase
MTEIVRDGYDKIADRFAEWRDRIVGDPRTELDLPAASFDAVASFYVFNHVPRERLAPLLRDVHGWLVPSGLLLAAFGSGDNEAWTGEWLGTTMFFSSYTPETNSRLVREAGFDPLRDELVTFEEPAGEVTFQWILARSI